MFEAGEPILMRTVVRGRVRFALPGVTVVDDGESIVVYRPLGTPTKVPASYLLPRHSAEARQWVEDRRSPFDGSLTSWRPDPSWTIPQITSGWDVV